MGFAGGAVAGDQALVVDTGLPALIAPVGGEVEHVPDERPPDEGPGGELLPGRLVEQRLVLLRVEVGAVAGDDQQALRVGAAAAWAMAACFMGLELWEWTHLSFGPTIDAYGSLYFTITGFHLAHLSVALALSAYLQLRAWLGHFNSQRHLAVENVSLYWHFVDAVWVVVFSTVYISPFIK